MATIVNGISLGSPGAPGAVAPVYVFRAMGAPTASPDPNVDQASIGSLYLQTDGLPGGTVWAKLTTGWSAIA